MEVINPTDGCGKEYGKNYIFLAGGISGCRNWQEEVIKKINGLRDLYDFSNIVLVNPRHPDFNVNDPGAQIKQIKWEHYWLEKSNAVTYFFDNSESLHPITLYELGKWANHKPNVITVVKGYKRMDDVVIQSTLDGLYVGIFDENDACYQHARAIANLIRHF